jgi:hypothetical protein
MNTTMTATRQDLEVLIQVIKENNIQHFTLKQQSESGIGYSTQVEYDTYINGREARVSIPITDMENW